jgi:2-polyprenyl-3-methyl-5-hydroxy-6-metoxy-1,4-benzoquinol methylase
LELVPEVAAIARQNSELDVILTGDVEQMQLDFPAAHFDLIIASHVLEHVKDPWSVARRLRSLLSAEGQLIGSLPNVRYASVSLPLVFFGKLQYAQEGILDWTHNKFFTRSTIQDLLHSSGFSVEKIEPEFAARPAAINTMTFGLFKHLLCFTYNFSARPTPAVAHAGLE